MNPHKADFLRRNPHLVPDAQRHLFDPTYDPNAAAHDHLTVRLYQQADVAIDLAMAGPAPLPELTGLAQACIQEGTAEAFHGWLTALAAATDQYDEQLTAWRQRFEPGAAALFCCASVVYGLSLVACKQANADDALAWSHRVYETFRLLQGHEPELSRMFERLLNDC